MNKKDPAFLFYYKDSADEVSHMNRLERGAYYDFLQAQRKFGGITVEQVRKVLGKDFDECWPALEMILERDGDRFLIGWLDRAIKERAAFAEKQRVRIQAYHDSKKKETGEAAFVDEDGKEEVIVNTNANEDVDVRNNRGSTTEVPRNESGKHSEDVKAVLAHLNQIAGTKYRPVESNAKHIRARLNEGMTVEELQMINVAMAYKWKDDPNFSGYLRPETLYGNKAHGYLEVARRAMETGIAPSKNGMSKIDERNARIRRESELLDQQRRSKIVNQ